MGYRMLLLYRLLYLGLVSISLPVKKSIPVLRLPRAGFSLRQFP